MPLVMQATPLDWHIALPGTVPASVRAWLLDTGSLTGHLLDASGGQFRVHVLQHRWDRAQPDEHQALGLGAREATMVREVVLLCHDEPWVYARSVLPARVLHGRHRHLRSFGARSLGAHLFANPHTRRDPFEVTQVPGDALPAGLASAGALLWARRSRFYLDHEPLLVAEVFLDAFRPWTLAP